MWLIVLLIMICTTLFIYRGTRKPSSLPPGLPRYPFIGSGPHLAPNMKVVISKLRQKYGKIFSVYLGNEPFVIVADFDLYKEAMAKEELLFRPSIGANDDFFFPDEHGERRGIMFANGLEWQEQRRFTMRNLRDFGFGKLSMEDVILEEVEKCVEMLSKELGRPTNLNLRLNLAIVNALWALLTGEKLSYDCPKSNKIVERFNLMAKSLNLGGLIRVFPWLKHIIPDYIGYTNVKKAMASVRELIEEAYQKNLDTFDPDNLRNFTDAFIKQQFDCKDDPNSSFSEPRGKQNYLAIIANLFIAGSDTTANALNFTLWYLCKYPQVQAKVQLEIDAVIGRDRAPSLNDKPALPYLMAVGSEVQRICGVAFMGIFRITKSDITIGGSQKGKPNGRQWIIPKNTIFTGALREMMRDPEYFENPSQFMPERFLDENGKYRPDEKLVPFGIGKRSCPGKTLADTELYLFLASFIQKFEFSFPEGKPIPDTIEPDVGVILVCPPYDLVIKQR